MSDKIYSQNYDIHEQGVLVEYRTSAAYKPAHWHDSLELVYVLNGSASYYLEGTEHKLVSGEFIVADAGQIHEARCTQTYMFIVIRIDEVLIEQLMDNKRNFQIICSRAELTDELLPAYLEICDCIKKLVPLHVRQPVGYRIARQSIVLDILYRLISNTTCSGSGRSYPTSTSTIRNRSRWKRSRTNSALTATTSAACSAKTLASPSPVTSTMCGWRISTTISVRPTNRSSRSWTSTGLPIISCSAACSRTSTAARRVKSAALRGLRSDFFKQQIRQAYKKALPALPAGRAFLISPPYTQDIQFRK